METSLQSPCQVRSGPFSGVITHDPAPSEETGVPP